MTKQISIIMEQQNHKDTSVFENASKKKRIKNKNMGS
jgi:hypothetical protein